MSHPDHFELFGLPARFAIDLEALEHAYKEVQARVHPDRYASGSAAERRVAMQWATRANEAYTTLRSPARRAAYLVERAGVKIDAENNTAMPADFLMEQMEWREAVMEARAGRDHHELEHLHNRLRADIDSRYEEVGQLLDDAKDFALATDRVRRLMFLEKLLSEIDDALASLEE